MRVHERFPDLRQFVFLQVPGRHVFLGDGASEIGAGEDLLFKFAHIPLADPADHGIHRQQRQFLLLVRTRKLGVDHLDPSLAQ